MSKPLTGTCYTTDMDDTWWTIHAINNSENAATKPKTYLSFIIWWEGVKKSIHSENSLKMTRACNFSMRHSKIKAKCSIINLLHAQVAVVTVV